jgi:hypothetical protein
MDSKRAIINVGAKKDDLDGADDKHFSDQDIYLYDNDDDTTKTLLLECLVPRAKNYSWILRTLREEVENENIDELENNTSIWKEEHQSALVLDPRNVPKSGAIIECQITLEEEVSKYRQFR